MRMMTEKDFDAKVKAIEKRFNQDREGADAGRDQALATLFLEAEESGRTQAWIGERMGQKQDWVSRRLLFGRFLNYGGRHNCKLPPDLLLTEWRFRTIWRKVGKRPKENEEDRFARTYQRLVADSSNPPRGWVNLTKRPGIKDAVIEAMLDGKRRTIPEIAQIVAQKIPDTGADQIREAFTALRKKAPKGKRFEGTHSGKTHKYRLVDRKRKDPVPIAVSIEEVGVTAAEMLPLVGECIKIMKEPEVSRQTSLVLEHLWRVQQSLQRLLVPEEVV